MLIRQTARRHVPRQKHVGACREGAARQAQGLSRYGTGVGKTYAMLAAAGQQSLRVVTWWSASSKTHGARKQRLSSRVSSHSPANGTPIGNRILMEFDIDAAIARRPDLLLVDEFAHTNAPGLVHAKRYQDVEGVLQAGIDVWTTLNIQHLESLTDVVEKITGINVRETVPDRVLERADEIVVVDLPPEDLIQRLKEGKVYLPTTPGVRSTGSFSQAT